MKRIIALGGSNSKNSINQSFAVYTAQQIKDCKLLEVKLTDYYLPIYGIDMELKKGIPDEAQKLSQLFDSVDGFVISLAEHNGSFSAAFKNALDWLSRINKKVWREKPVLLLSASPGPRGGLNVLETAKNIFPYLGAKINSSFSLASFEDNFENGKLTNLEIKSNLLQQVERFRSIL